MEIIAIAISVIALGVSVGSLFYAKRQADAAVATNRHHDDDRARAEKTARSASLVASASHYGNDHALEIRNEGQDVARDIHLEATVPADVTGTLPPGEWDVSGDLAAGSSIRIPFIWTFGSADQIQLSVTWTDREGDHEFACLLQL